MEVKLTKREVGLLRRIICSVTDNDSKGDSYLANGVNPLWERQVFLSDKHLVDLLGIEGKLKSG